MPAPVTACCPPLTQAPLDDAAAADFARAFKALGDPVRLRLLSMITARGGAEVCVCDLVAGVARSGPTVSHHLKILREAGLVTAERRGTWVFYRARPDALGPLAALLTGDA